MKQVIYLSGSNGMVGKNILDHIESKNYKMKVNNKNCIMLTQLYGIHQFRESDLLKIVKNDITDFLFSVERQVL